MLNPQHFLRPCGLASHAVSEPLANQQRRGLYGRAIVSNWQGPMWVLPNALAVKALLGYGYEGQARELASRIVKCLAESIEKHGTLYENYDAESGVSTLGSAVYELEYFSPRLSASFAALKAKSSFSASSFALAAKFHNQIFSSLAKKDPIDRLSSPETLGLLEDRRVNLLIAETLSGEVKFFLLLITFNRKRDWQPLIVRQLVKTAQHFLGAIR
jgi:hypothetical protein